MILLSCKTPQLISDGKWKPSRLLISNVYKPEIWTIRGYVYLDTLTWECQYLNKNKKPIPDYIIVWDYKLIK